MHGGFPAKSQEDRVSSAGMGGVALQGVRAGGGFQRGRQGGFTARGAFLAQGGGPAGRR